MITAKHVYVQDVPLQNESESQPSYSPVAAQRIDLSRLAQLGAVTSSSAAKGRLKILSGLCCSLGLVDVTC